jgi:iron-sulfur cluster repair protein YtfE (RIC family)
MGEAQPFYEQDFVTSNDYLDLAEKYVSDPRADVRHLARALEHVTHKWHDMLRDEIHRLQKRQMIEEEGGL